VIGGMTYIGILESLLSSFELVSVYRPLRCMQDPGNSDDGSAGMTSSRIQYSAIIGVFGRLFFAARVSFVVMITLTVPAWAEAAASADAFVDSVGVNIHLTYLDTSYSNFPKVKQSLLNLGVRHVRDGLVDTTSQDYYNHHNELGRSGIKGIFITSPVQSDQLLLDYPQRMKDSFEGYEAPNEYDLSHDPDWAGTLSKFVTRLNATVKANSSTSRFPVIGPSLTSQGAFLKMRGLCSFDSANLHDYFGGRNPGTLGWGSNGYGSITWSLGNVTTACPGKTVMTTETGYQTDPAMTQGIPEDIAAKYLPRVVLEQWQRGIKRTYLYELIDFPPGRGAGDSMFGLLRSDFSPKPAYSSLMNLLHLLADPGPSYAGEELKFTLTGEVSDVHHVLFQKRNGIFYLALWVEEPSYDVNGKKAIAVPTRHVVVQSDEAVRIVSHTLGKSGAVQNTTLASSTTHAVDATDYVTVLEIDSRPAAPVMHAAVVH
jgi:hypothetical protein